ncbi:hypothetical protein PIB30_057584 [Stylosanthes scabra]|uniref:Uncharacterized protein n=1 Tax=Stylosanthes scabra TaxID=79078 RepID=A0ABU6SJM6_9FABA|nr:hypothetical protein [Stylosanthes scabra]
MNHHDHHQDNNNGGDVLNTVVESLRGRLLAERHASRLARDKAHSLQNRFLELENKLTQETKLRDKAQRKLEFFKEKLQSLRNNDDSIRVSSISTKSASVIKNEDEEEEDDVEVDNSLALVPVSVTLVTNNNNNNNEKGVHESVIEALDALRRAKEGLLCAMIATTRTTIIKVDPTHILEHTNDKT